MAKIRSPFQPRPISAERVAVVEAVTASVPVTGEPVQEKLGPVQVLEPVVQDIVQTKQLASTDAVVYRVGQVYDVPQEQVLSNPFNPRAIYTSSAVDEMSLSLADKGQRVSAIGYVNEHGRVVLIEGETRLRGVRAISFPTLRIEIRERPASDQKLYEEARAANVERRDQTPLDDAIRWKDLLAKKIYPTQRALGTALGLAEDAVSRVMSLANMPNRVINAVAEYPELLTLKMLVALREYCEVQGEEATLELILEIAKSGLGSREVISRRKAAEKGPTKRPRSSREAVQFKGAKGELKFFEEEGRVELSLKGLSANASAELGAMLKKLFVQDAQAQAAAVAVQ